MENYATRARSYRERAEQASAFSEQMATLEAKRMMAALAKDFIQVADMLDRLAARHPASVSH
jgi:hypothetical protein